MKNLIQTTKKWGVGLLDFLFPPLCPLCSLAAPHPHQLCEPCQKALPAPPENYCLRCGVETPRPELGCGSCLPWVGRPDRIYFPFVYQGGIAKLLIGFKFSDRSEWSTLLVELCWLRLEAELRWEEPELILPIPLHPRRLIARRYNQSALLAAGVAKKLNRPLVTNGLKRIKITLPQTRLSAQRRRENVQGAFWACRGRLAGRSVLLIDDVFTTGATMASAVAALRRAGVRRVALLCFARTPIIHD
ncbi:MAG: ComF family protein [Magnetococcales bacterium]|nr:ComF family protein [Magnetococcales bacterium]